MKYGDGLDWGRSSEDAEKWMDLRYDEKVLLRDLADKFEREQRGGEVNGGERRGEEKRGREGRGKEEPWLTPRFGAILTGEF